jgi:hypothetical protein
MQHEVSGACEVRGKINPQAIFVNRIDADRKAFSAC